jgi:hypothetical protein
MSETINLTPLVQQQSTSRMQFIEKYWFSNLQMVTVRNPFDGDVVFMHEMRTYAVKQGTEARLPGTIANLYIDLVARTLAQNSKDLSAIGDPSRCAKYYDEIIISTEDSMPEYDTATGFAVKKNTPMPTPTQPFQAEDFEMPGEKLATPEPAKETMKPGETKEFMLGEDAFVKAISEDGVEAYLKNGEPVDVTEYARAVSLL